MFPSAVIRPFICPVSFNALSAFLITSKTSVSSVFLNFILMQLMHKLVLNTLSNFSQILDMFSPVHFLRFEQIKLPIQIKATQNTIQNIFLLDSSAISSIRYWVPRIVTKGDSEFTIMFKIRKA